MMKAKVKFAGTTYALSGLGCCALIGILASLSAAGPKGADIKVEAQVETPRIIAVRIRHDMCPFCKKFDPQFAELLSRTDHGSVLFVTLDLTSESTQQQAALLTGALGLERVWTGDLTKIGTISILDGISKQVLSTVYQVDGEMVRKALRDALKSMG